MSDFRTISPDELPEISEIPEGLLAVVFEPNGPLQSVSIGRLVSKLIAADLAKASKALLDADLEHPADSVALVFSDPTAELNGWYRKLGASGAGSWSQFEELARNSRILAQAAATSAAGSASAAADILTDVQEAGTQQVGAVNAAVADYLLQLLTTASQGALGLSLVDYVFDELASFKSRMADFMRTGNPVCLAARVRKHGWELEIDVLAANGGGTFDISRMLVDVFDWGFDNNCQLVVRPRRLRVTRLRRLPAPNQASIYQTTTGGISTLRLSLDQPVFAKAKRNAPGQTGNTGKDPILRLDAGWYTFGGVQAGPQDGIYVINNSDRPYPLEPVRSLLPPFRLLGATARFEVGGNSLDPQQGRVWAAVRFDLTGLSSGVTRTQIVSAMTASTAYPRRTNAVPCFAAVFDMTPFTQGAEVSARFRTYPWIGDTPTDSQSGSTYDFANEVHTVGPIPMVRAFVDAVSGNDTTGAATTGSEATAKATPFLTERIALLRAWQLNRSAHSRNSQSGIEIIFADGQRHRLSLVGALSGSGDTDPAFFDAAEVPKAGTWCVYRPENGATNCIIERNPAITLGATVPRRTVLRGFTGLDLLSQVGTGTRGFLNGLEVQAGTYGQEVWFDNSPFIDSTGATSNVIGYTQCGRVWMTNCNQPALGTVWSGTGTVPNEMMLLRDTDFADCRQWPGARATAGVSIRSLGGTSFSMVEFSQAVVNLGKPAQDNLVFLGFSLRSSNSSNIVFRYGTQRVITRIGVLNALFEAYGAGNLGNVDIGGSANIRISNCFWDYATIVGGPTRIGYEDTYVMTDDGDPEQQLKEWLLIRRMIIHEADLKGDLFPPANGARIHTMNVLHWVGSKYVDILRPTSGSNAAPGTGSWMGEAWPGTFRYLGPDARSDFESYAASFAAAGVNGVGNGDYTPAAGSRFLNRIIARSEADHAQALRQLLPRGAAWDFAPEGPFARLLEALAAEFARIDARVLQLLDEADPRTALETLIDWERVAGLPDACTGAPDNVGERQVALFQKLTGLGGQSPTDFIDLAARVGFEIDIVEHRALRTGFRVGDPCNDIAWAHAWTVVVQPFDGAGRPVLAIAHFKVGDPVGTRVRGFGSLDLECVKRPVMVPNPDTRRNGRAGRRDRGQVPPLPAAQFMEAFEPFSERRERPLRRRYLWLHVPPGFLAIRSTACRSAPDMAGSTSGLPSPSPDIALHVSSSGKLTLRPLSWPGWRTRPWIRHLSGTICDPSTADRGAAAFISSLPVIPASPSASRASAAARPIPGTCGPRSRGSSTRSARASSSPRTSRGTSIWDLPRSPAAFAGWATAQKRACSQREKSAVRTGVVDSSSWPTPTASDAGYMPDLMVAAGSIQPRSPFYVAETSSGQFSLSNAARTWTKLWLVLMALGWTAAMACRSSPPVRVSFNVGNGSYIGVLISNPRFFELIMGWPIGWTAPGAQVTGFAAWLRLSRTALWQLTLPASAPGSEGCGDA